MHITFDYRGRFDKIVEDVFQEEEAMTSAEKQAEQEAAHKSFINFKEKFSKYFKPKKPVPNSAKRKHFFKTLRLVRDFADNTDSLVEAEIGTEHSTIELICNRLFHEAVEDQPGRQFISMLFSNYEDICIYPEEGCLHLKIVLSMCDWEYEK